MNLISRVFLHHLFLCNVLASDVENTKLKTHTNKDKHDNETKEGFDSVIEKESEDFVNKINASIPNPTYITENLSFHNSCGSVVRETCSELKDLNELKCGLDEKMFTISQLCDGFQDCPDGFDEGNCLKQAVDRVYYATRIMNKVTALEVCFNITNPQFTTQNEVLTNLLEMEIKLIKRDIVIQNKTNDTASSSHLAIELSTAVLTVHASLNGALCHITNEVEDRTRSMLPAKWSAKSCVCEGEYCKHVNCGSDCKQICFQTYSLRRYGCRATTGDKSIPLNEVCDGKIDCYDKSDESDCLYEDIYHSKFKASQIFNDVLKMLLTYVKMKEYELIWGEIILLYNEITKLRDICKNPNENVDNFKSGRDRIFQMMSSIYIEMIEKDPENADSYHDLLLFINKRFVNALKRLQICNENAKSEDGCFCRDAECAMAQCSKKCNTTCYAMPVLTTYACSSSLINITSVPINAICNGKPNCPNGEDEIDCKNDICRNYHLVALRHNLRAVGEKEKGTIVGELINAWKTKADAILNKAEQRARLTPAVFQHVIGDILNHLVNVYTAVDYRRLNTETVLKRFKKLAQFTLESLKSCGT